jgi:hypothetical protein
MDTFPVLLQSTLNVQRRYTFSRTTQAIAQLKDLELANSGMLL